MDNAEIEALVNATPMKMLTDNMNEVAAAISTSYESNDKEQLQALVANGTALLDAIGKLNEV